MQIEKNGNVLVLGTFDGVHAGHRALIGQAAELAESLCASPLIYTFTNHPLSLFGQEPRLLMTPQERIAALAETGVRVVADAFDAQLAATPPEAFVRMLCARFAVRGIVSGFNYTFGQKGAGNATLLSTLGQANGFAVKVLAPVSYEGAPVSSTRIRTALENGALAEANAMLGARYQLNGTVAHSRCIGHTLGFPTANLEGYGNKVLPCAGVYATYAHVAGKRYDAVTNVGNNPTVAGRSTTVETHLLGFDSDIYGMPLRVEFVARLRGEVKFADTEALAAQIARDAEEARAVLKIQGK